MHNNPLFKMAAIRSMIVVTTVLLLSMSSTSSSRNSLQDSIDQAVQSEMERQKAVGVAIGVIQNGKIIHTSGYGWADQEKMIPVQRGTMFRWASISKPLTAVAAMQLVEQDQLDLDADIRLVVPEFPDKGKRITMRQLLGHLGGIVHYRNGPVVKTSRTYGESHPHKDVVLALDRFKESPLVAEPGAEFAYTTHGYILASAVIQRSGKQPYHLQVRDRVTRPLKLNTLQPDYQWQSIPGRAVGYRRKDGKIVPSRDTNVSWKLGGGGWISNIGDLASFAEALMTDELVSAESRKIMWTRQRNAEGKQLTYGLGFGISGSGDSMRITHSGSQEKTRTRLTIYPEQGHGVVIMTNSEYADPEQFTKAIYKAMTDHQQQFGPEKDRIPYPD